MAEKKRSPLLQQSFQIDGLMPLEGKLIEKKNFPNFLSVCIHCKFCVINDQ